MNRIELSFKDKGIAKVGTVVYSKQVAIDFINECRKYDIAILGIDALIITEKITQPSMDNSIDFSTSSYSQFSHLNVWDRAVKFLNERDDIFYFEIVCDEDASDSA